VGETYRARLRRLASLPRRASSSVVNTYPLGADAELAFHRALEAAFCA
jgi:hypothetical protein